MPFSTAVPRNPASMLPAGVTRRSGGTRVAGLLLAERALRQLSDAADSADQVQRPPAAS